MTQGQWIRLAGSNPSYYRPNPAFREEHESLVFDLAHPVENMSWYEAEAWLRRHGLSLPTEAQWEYACRAGTDTPFWTGAGRESLVGRINIADLTTTEVLKGITEHLRWPDFQDGYVAHCRVGEYEPNPFGLFNVHGNVFEWCADRWNLYELGFAAGDGRLTPGGREERILRGGSWRYSEDRIRSATRSVMQPDDGGVHIGVRPARILDR
jgi:formylglycine-generating enzyme required for sulfatase activity